MSSPCCCGVTTRSQLAFHLTAPRWIETSGLDAKILRGGAAALVSISSAESGVESSIQIFAPMLEHLHPISNRLQNVFGNFVRDQFFTIRRRTGNDDAIRVDD